MKTKIQKIEKELNFDLEMDLHGVRQEAEYIEKSGYFFCRLTEKRLPRWEGVRVDWKHLFSLVDEAKKDSGFDNLPWNLYNPVNAGLVNGYPRFASKEALMEQVIVPIKRFCGWLRSAEDFPALKKVIERSQSNRGVHSRHTILDLWSLARKWPSPGALERRLWKVRRRADGIYASFFTGDARVSWASIADALIREKRIGKAAVIAVASHISGNSFWSYRAARDWLVEYHRCSVADFSDGVGCRREPTPRMEKLGIAIYKIALPQLTRRGGRVGTIFGWLVCSPTGRTYHSQFFKAKDALKDTLSAWKRQDEAMKADMDFLGFLRGEKGFSPLIYREDSYTAGNCHAGTAAWMQKQGWNERTFIPGVWLIPHLDYNLVKNVATVAYRRHLSEVA